MKINQDIVKETEENNFLSDNQEDVLVSDLSDHPINQNIKKLAFFSSATVELIENKGIDSQLVAFSSDTGFRVKNLNKSGLIGVAKIGKGEIIVIGDTSLFTDSKLNSLESGDNQQLTLNIFGW